MAASTVTGKLVNPTGPVASGATVTFVLVDLNDEPVAGFDTADMTETVDTSTATPADDGSWSAPLVPNASIQLFDGAESSAYRVTESSAGASSTYWIVVTDVSPSWVGDLRTAEVSPGAVAELPGTWCSLTDVRTYTGNAEVTQADVNLAQVVLEGHIHRVWRVTDVQTRDYHWLTRATAFQALYHHAHPELMSMMDIQSQSQDGLQITYRPGTSGLPLIAPFARVHLDALYRSSNTTIRLNSAFQKNRSARRGRGGAGSASWVGI